MIDQEKYFDQIYFSVEFAFYFLAASIFSYHLNTYITCFCFLMIPTTILCAIISDNSQPLTIGRIPIYIQAIALGWLNQSRITEAIFSQSINEYKEQTEQIIKLQQEIFELEQKQFDADLKRSLKGDGLDWHIYKVIHLPEKPF